MSEHDNQHMLEWNCEGGMHVKKNLIMKAIQCQGHSFIYAADRQVCIFICVLAWLFIYKKCRTICILFCTLCLLDFFTGKTSHFRRAITPASIYRVIYHTLNVMYLVVPFYGQVSIIPSNSWTSSSDRNFDREMI